MMKVNTLRKLLMKIWVEEFQPNHPPNTQNAMFWRWLADTYGIRLSIGYDAIDSRQIVEGYEIIDEAKYTWLVMKWQ